MDDVGVSGGVVYGNWGGVLHNGGVLGLGPMPEAGVAQPVGDTEGESDTQRTAGDRRKDKEDPNRRSAFLFCPASVTPAAPIGAALWGYPLFVRVGERALIRPVRATADDTALTTSPPACFIPIV